MHSNSSEYDTELKIPTKRMKLSSQEEVCIARNTILSQILLREIQQEINLRKEDLESIEENIFAIRQKLIHLKQVVAADYYQQKSVKGSLQYPPHPAVKDSLIGKCPAGIENYHSIITSTSESVELYREVKKDTESILEETNNDIDKNTATDFKKLLEGNKLPCYIAPNLPDNNVIKPAEPRDLQSKKEIRIIVGNVSKWLAPFETSDATHKWTVYAKVAELDLDISLFVSKVVFYLHKSYRPNDVIEIRNPPYKLTRRGWGEFPLKAQFHFKNLSDPPIDVMHHLKLDHVHTGFETFGAETSLTVWVQFPFEYESNNNRKKLINPTSVNLPINNSNDLKCVTKIDNFQVEQTFFSDSKANQHNCFDSTNTINEIFSSSFLTDDVFVKDENEYLNFDLKHDPCDVPVKNENYDLSINLKRENLCDVSDKNENKTLNVDLKQEHLSGLMSDSSLFDDMKSEKLFTSLCEDKFNINQNFIENKYLKETNLYSNNNEFNEDDCTPVAINDGEVGGLFMDECTVVGEEVVIDCAEPDGYHNRQSPVQSKSFSDVETDFPLKGNDNNTLYPFSSSTKSVSTINKVDMSSNLVEYHYEEEGNYTIISSNNLVCDTISLNKNHQNTETLKGINKNFNSNICEETSTTIKLDKKIHYPVNLSKTSNDVINGDSSALNTSKKFPKNSEKKSMIITLQKENGQIILRKEAKIKKCKINTSPKTIPNTLIKEPKSINMLSLLSSKPVILKQNQVTFDVKRGLPVKILSNEELKLNQNSQSGSKQDARKVQKRFLPGISLLKKVRNVNKELVCGDKNNSDSINQCPTQNTEIAINWLMKKFPLVDTRCLNAGFHTTHPYCAKNRDTFLSWPIAKQRAAEWMRAKAVGRILNKFPNLEKWTTLEILDWARVRCYTPLKSDPDYNGPTIEPSLNFVYQPRIDGILEFLNKHKMATEEEVVDVVTIGSLKKEDPLSSDNREFASTSQNITKETDCILQLDPEIQGYRTFINKCMKNSVGEMPMHELLLPEVAYPAVERILISVFSSIAEELIRRSHNASYIRHCDNPPPEINVNDVKAAILSRKEFDFLLPHKDNKGREQPSVLSFFRK